MELTFTWHEKQLEMFSFEQRFLISHCGRQFGKTRGGIQWGIGELITNDGDEGWFVSKTYKQAKVAFNYLLKIRDEKCGLENIVKSVNRTDLIVTFDINGKEKRICFMSAERPDNLRGQPLAFLIVDEAGMLADEIWSTVLRPSLMAYKCRVVFIGTPKGMNWYFNLYNEALKNTKDYSIRNYSSYDNPYLDTEEVKKAEAEMAAFSPAMVRQEIYGEFVIADIKVFKDLHKCVVEPDTVVTTPQDGHYYVMGVDIAIMRDDTAIVIVDATDMVVCHVECFSKVKWELQEIRMKQIHDMYFNPIIYMDCSNQSMVADDLEMKYGVAIEKIRITKNNKAEMVSKAATYIARQNIKIPRNEMGQQLVSQMNMFERTFSGFGNEKFSGHGKQKDDAVMAFCLAIRDVDIEYKQPKTKEAAEWEIAAHNSDGY